MRGIIQTLCMLLVTVVAYSYASLTYAATSNNSSILFERDLVHLLSIEDSSQVGLDLLESFTLEAWVKIDSEPSVNSAFTFMSKWLETENNRNYAFIIITKAVFKSCS